MLKVVDRLSSYKDFSFLSLLFTSGIGEAEIYLQWMRLADALTFAQKGAELQPNRPWAHWVLGLVYFRLGEYAQALNSLQKVVELKGDFLPAHNMIVTLYRTLGEEERAQEWQRRSPLQGTPVPFLFPGLGGKEPQSSR